MSSMSTGTAMALPNNPYAETFLYFQRLFASTNDDVSQIQLASYLPEELYGDRTALGCALTGALMAMFEHKVKGRGDWSLLSIREVQAVVATMPPELLDQLDEILLEQAKIAGIGLTASDVALHRVLKWEREDRSKTGRWLRALDKAARVLQRRTAAPLNDPFRRQHKKDALKEVAPAIRRLQQEFKKRRRDATPNDILCAFFREARNPDLPFLSNRQNLPLWLDYCQTNPLSFLKESPEYLFDGFVGFVTQHAASTARKK